MCGSNSSAFKRLLVEAFNDEMHGKVPWHRKGLGI